MEVEKKGEENIFSPFFKNLILITLFFIFTPLTIGVSIFSLFLITMENNKSPTNNEVITQNFKTPTVFAALPQMPSVVSGEIQTEDARPFLIKKYLENFDSPLVNYVDTIIKASDTYGLDYRLLTAIAQQESNLCKKIPKDSFNCWGWGIHSRGTLKFSSYEEAIWTVAKGLKEEYLDKGYNTPDEIMKKYTPLSNGSWAEAVNFFMIQIAN